MKTNSFLLVFLALMISVVPFTHAAIGVSTPSIIAVKFHSDNCGSCKAIAPAHEELISKYSSKAVPLLTFDMTDETATHQSTLLASSLGLSEVFQDHQKTGFVLLVDGGTKQPVGKLTKHHSLEEMSHLLDMTLSGKNVLDHAAEKGSMMKGSGSGGHEKKGS